MARLNWYDLYRAPIPETALLVSDVQGDARYKTTTINGEERKYKRGYTQSEYTPWVSGMKHDKEVILGDYISDYMNRADVREAMHIPDYVPTWQMCSDTIDYHLQDEGSVCIYDVL